MDKAVIDFWGEICIISLPLKRHKNNFYFFMVTFLKELVAGYEDTNDKIAKIVIYNEIRKYLENSNPWAVAYDMEAYVMLYKYAATPSQRMHALNQICDIIIDDFIGDDGIVSNFKDFLVVKSFLHEDDVDKFDSLCMCVLRYFDDKVKKISKSKKHSTDFNVLKKYLREVVESVKSLEMENMKSHKFACEILS